MNNSDGETPWAGESAAGRGVLLRVPARKEYLALIGLAVRWSGRQAGLSEEKFKDLEVAVDEACSNVIRHGFPDQADGEMTVVFSPVPAGMQVTILDRGKPFDPDEGAEIAREKQSHNPASGGMGLLLISQLTDSAHYDHDRRKGNRLTLVKHK
jgi:serine/threonine-protein kinase RsbW